MTRTVALLPASTVFAGTVLPATVASALGRADRAHLASGEEAQLLRHFRTDPAEPWPAAALARLVDATGEGDGTPPARQAAWLRADPAHVRPDINGARLLGVGRSLGLDPGDAAALLPALVPVLADAGMSLSAPHPERWYLQVPLGEDLPRFSTPVQALGEDIFDHRPQGPAARPWRAVDSEIQVVLHNHPHNAERAARGLVPINALWFWGAGRLPDRVTAGFATLYSDDPALRGAARLANIATMDVPATMPATVGEALLDLRRIRDWRLFVDGWLAPLVQAGAADEVLLDFADGLQLRLAPGQRWRLWRAPLRALGTVPR